MLDRRTHPVSPDSPAGGGLPRPRQAVLPYVTIIAAAGPGGAVGAIPREWMLALAGAALAAGAAAVLWSWLHRLALCDRADHYLALGDGEAPSAAVLDERRAMLVGDRDRRETALALRRLVRCARRAAPSVVRIPVDRPAVLADAELIEELAARIERPHSRVPARKMTLAHVLLSDAASPIYADTGTGEDSLHRALVRIELELGA